MSAIDDPADGRIIRVTMSGVLILLKFVRKAYLKGRKRSFFHGNVE
ncbi:MAG: hypothetical protein WCH83_04490 [Alphaproteobacteria bacterium]